MWKENVQKLARLMLCLSLLAGFLTVLIMKGRQADFVSAQATENSKEERRPKADNNYLFTEPRPLGNWLFEVADFDIDQTHNTIPVVIAGIRSYTGKGNWRKHLMIESIVLKSRTSKTIKAYRLAWIIMTAEDHRAGKNREAALLEGQTDFIEPGFTNLGGRTKPFYLEVLKAAKPLIRDGRLDGTFAIRIRLAQVQFEDGSIWIEG